MAVEFDLEARIAQLREQARARKAAGPDLLCTVCLHQESRHDPVGLCVTCATQPTPNNRGVRVDPVHDFTRAKHSTTTPRVRTGTAMPPPAPPTIPSRPTFQWATVEPVTEIPYGSGSGPGQAFDGSTSTPHRCAVEVVTNTEGTKFVRLRTGGAAMAFSLGQLASLHSALSLARARARTAITAQPHATTDEGQP